MLNGENRGGDPIAASGFAWATLKTAVVPRFVGFLAFFIFMGSMGAPCFAARGPV